MQPDTRPMRRALLRLLAYTRPLIAPAAPVPAPRRILLIKPDHLGDLLLATPAITRLRQHVPHAHLSLLVGAWAAPIVAHNQHLNALQTLPFPGFVRQAQRPHLLQPYALLLHTAALLRSQHYDAALLLRDDHWWGAALALLAGIPQRVGMAVPDVAALLTLAVPYHPRQHVAAQALAVVDTLVQGVPVAPVAGWQPDLPPLYYTPPAPDQAWARHYVQQHAAEQDLIVIHPGTGGASKHWLASHWAAVARALSQLDGVRLLLTGGAGEVALVQELAAQVQPAPLVLAGKTSIGQLAALLAHATLVLGVDSGPLHLAVSQGVPSLHLFGPSDPQRFGPWGDPLRHVVLHADLPCRPCGVFAACPRGLAVPECMAVMSVAQVLAQVRQMKKR